MEDKIKIALEAIMDSEPIYCFGFWDGAAMVMDITPEKAAKLFLVTEQALKKLTPEEAHTMYHSMMMVVSALVCTLLPYECGSGVTKETLDDLLATASVGINEHGDITTIFKKRDHGNDR